LIVSRRESGNGKSMIDAEDDFARSPKSPQAGWLVILDETCGVHLDQAACTRRGRLLDPNRILVSVDMEE
jgi:hypothetical protein